MSPTLRVWLKRLALGAAGVLAIVVLWVIVSLSRDRPVDYADIQEHFKYGSIGSEPGGSLLAPIGGVLPPYWVFKSLPSVCRDKLPDGYATFGFITEPGKDLPIGVSRRRRLGIDQVGLNCALCHTATVRETGRRTAANRSGHAGEPTRSSGVRAIRFGLHAGQPADRRRRAWTVPEAGRSIALRAHVDPDRPDRSPQAADLGSAQSHGPDPFAPGAAMGAWARGHVQPVQGHSVQLGPGQVAAKRIDRGIGLPVDLESAAARGNAPALGWRQRFGGRAQPQRIAGCGRHPAHGRSRTAQTRA